MSKDTWGSAIRVEWLRNNIAPHDEVKGSVVLQLTDKIDDLTKKNSQLQARVEELKEDRAVIFRTAENAHKRHVEGCEFSASFALCEILCPIDGGGEMHPGRLPTQSTMAYTEKLAARGGE